MAAGAYAGDMACAAEMAAAMVGGAGVGTMIAAVVMMVGMPVITAAPAIVDNANVGAGIIARAIITGTARVISGRGATGQQEREQGQGE
jgi:hypothetical protein